MANYHEQMSFLVPMPMDVADRLHAVYLDELSKTLEQLEDDGDHPIFQDEPYSFPLLTPVAEGMWIQDDAGESSGSCAANVVEWLLKQDGVDDGDVFFETASTCDKPRMDAFGGAAFYVTKDGWVGEWTGGRIEALEHRLRRSGKPTLQLEIQLTDNIRAVGEAVTDINNALVALVEAGVVTATLDKAGAAESDMGWIWTVKDV